jgi:transketolase
MFTAAAKAMLDSRQLRLGKANLDVFAETLLELARDDRNVVVVVSDSRGSGKLKPFADALPGQVIETGIAEQNLVGVAAGLASAGKTVFAASPACFLTARSLEQIKNDLAYSDNPVVLVGISAGVSYGALGSTHHSLHDLAVLRAINNITVVAPADNPETRAAVRLAARHRHPVYLRFGKVPQYDLPGSGQPFEFGKARVVRDGRDLAIIATGETVIHAWLAAELLAVESGIDARVISMPTVKPLDTAAVLDAAGACGALITVEEHMVHGGLGEACAGVVAQSGIPCRMRIMGIPDEYTVPGSQADIFRHYGLTMEGIAAAARGLPRRV